MTLSVVGIFGLTTGTVPVVLAVELLVAVDMVVLVLAVEMDAGLGWAGLGGGERVSTAT